MKFEFSAGGVVFKVEDNLILILVAQHSFHHGWVFPKGLIGDASAGSAQAKETKETAAVREVKEETGAEGKILQELTPVTYWYQMEGEKRRKTVYYFLMEYTGGDINIHDHEMEAVEWLPLEAVSDRLTYKSDKDVYKEARPFIEKLAKS